MQHVKRFPINGWLNSIFSFLDQPEVVKQIVQHAKYFITEFFVASLQPIKILWMERPQTHYKIHFFAAAYKKNARGI
jgi:hypothetical protein